MEGNIMTYKKHLSLFFLYVLFHSILIDLNATPVLTIPPISEMSRVTLDGSNVLTQEMMPLKTGENTIYVVRKNFKLETNITIPNNCVLLFDGGSILGDCTLNGQGTYLSGILLNVIDKNVVLKGDWHFQNISPDWFIGSDLEKVQKAFDVSISNRSTQISIDRTYNLTGGTVYIDRGYHSADEISKWSRRNLIVSGIGEGRLIKEDTGFMFSANSASIDFEFNNIHFRGYVDNSNKFDIDSDMCVFDCRYLGNVHVSHCSFCHCGCVFYQKGDVSTPMIGVLSIGNQYMKNKCVMKANECWHSQFIGDAIDDGISFVEGENYNSNIRDLKITNCCIEGFYFDNTAAINLNCNAPGISITDNYFEANFCSIKITRYVTGTITGNAFHSRGSYIKKEHELHCIELAGLKGINITANNVVVDDENMCLFFFDLSSPYYVQSQVLVGCNAVEGETRLSNVEGKVKDLNLVVNSLENNYIDNITNKLKKFFSQIEGGCVVISNYRGMTTISISDLIIKHPINSGYYTGHSINAKPYNQSLPIRGAIVDKDNNKIGLVYVTSDGNIGIRVDYPGTYNGVITYPHY